MAKLHLFLSSRPLHPGENVAARCGDLVTKAQLIHAWDKIPTGVKVDWPMGICRDCIRAAEGKHEGPSFVYAIVSKEQVGRKAE